MATQAVGDILLSFRSTVKNIAASQKHERFLVTPDLTVKPERQLDEECGEERGTESIIKSIVSWPHRSSTLSHG